MLRLRQLCVFGTLALSNLAIAAPLEPAVWTDFKVYVLALSWQPAFCQTWKERDKLPEECKDQTEFEDKRRNLTLHGLWPSLPKSFAEVMQLTPKPTDQEQFWMDFGCAAPPMRNPYVSSKNKCDANDLKLSESFSTKLREYMPGANSKTCLDEYEFAKHGVCFKFDPETYYERSIALNEAVRASEVGKFFADNYGKQVNIADLKAAMRKAYGDNAAKGLEWSCSNKDGKKYLTEIRLAILKEKINLDLSPASFEDKTESKNDCIEGLLIDKRGL